MPFFRGSYVLFIPVQKSRTNFRQKSVFDGIEKDGNGIKTVPQRIKADSPDKEMTVPDFFTPIKDSKKTAPD